MAAAYVKLRNGIPGHDTIWRVFEALSPAVLEICLVNRCKACAGCTRVGYSQLTARACAAPVQPHAALARCTWCRRYAAEIGLTLGQQPWEEKSNEIEAIKALLPTLALEGAVVTIDAIV